MGSLLTHLIRVLGKRCRAGEEGRGEEEEGGSDLHGRLR